MGGSNPLDGFMSEESDEDAPYQQEEEEEEASDLDEPGTSEDDSDASPVETGPPKVTKKVTAPAKKAVEAAKPSPAKVTKKAPEAAKPPQAKVAKKTPEAAKPPQAEPVKKVVKKAPEAAKKVAKKAVQAEKPSASQETPFTKASAAVQQPVAKQPAKHAASRKRKGGDQNEAPAEKKKAATKAAPAPVAPVAPASATVSQKPPIVHVAFRAAGVTIRMSGTPAECGGRIHCVFEGMGFGPDIFVNVPVRSFSITAPRGSAFFNEAVSSPDDTEQMLMYFSINDADAFMLVYKIRDALGVLRSMVNKATA